jgi:hypothetical protein
MEDARKDRRGPSDATDYSSTKAPATQKYAEGRRPRPRDERLQPGGGRAAPEDPGIASLDPESTIVPDPHGTDTNPPGDKE